MHRLYPRSVFKGTVSTISVPRPVSALGASDGAASGAKPGQPLRDVPLLDWARSVLVGVLGEPPAPAGTGAAPVATPATSA